ncbi:hypothetical protein FA09DRAFT_156983 [Tilletiopsis washingtonensis]|uniref:Uncharacterized protein n=1 Tax=Tilletiopsis washingtonensis TaxID=58919 RepID=A0A316YZX6_9BASI|nr:hypothetical protein FA09DRAFT_156983 [Tilletiopsis washingtonensis]PWN95007.1 hypothetical protein FA09DRAFT_156983 [Tilletiopsis washingtonensis]
MTPSLKVVPSERSTWRRVQDRHPAPQSPASAIAHRCPLLSNHGAAGCGAARSPWPRLPRSEQHAACEKEAVESQPVRAGGRDVRTPVPLLPALSSPSYLLDFGCASCVPHLHAAQLDAETRRGAPPAAAAPASSSPLAAGCCCHAARASRLVRAAARCGIRSRRGARQRSTSTAGCPGGPSCPSAARSAGRCS